jgi:hypothetical protein
MSTYHQPSVLLTVSPYPLGPKKHRFFEADVMVGTRRPGKGQNMEIYEKRTLV